MSAPAANVEKSSVVKGSFLERGVRVYPDTLMPKLRRLKGDGIINVRFDQTQVLPVNPSPFRQSWIHLFFVATGNNHRTSCEARARWHRPTCVAIGLDTPATT